MTPADEPSPEALLRWIADHAGGIPSLGKYTDVKVETLRRWQRPDGFPRARLSHNVEVIHSWAVKNLGERYPPEGYARAGLLAFVTADDDAEATASEPAPSSPVDRERADVSRARRRRWPLVALLAAVVAGSIGTAFMIGHAASTPAYKDLDIGHLTKPRPPDQRQAAPPCERKQRWEHLFPDDYVGDVYVYFAADSTASVPSVVQLDWGDQYWRRQLDIQPGSVQTGEGGTLRAFKKYSTTQQNPGHVNLTVVFTSSVPVCATFGTADSSPLPAPLEKDFTPGWQRRDS